MAYRAPVMASNPVTLKPILVDDVEAVGDFLHSNLNSRLSPEEWSKASLTTWPGVEPPNHGYMLVCDGTVVGANLAFYSARLIDGGVHQVCNLAALCVMDEFRVHTVRLVRALLRQGKYTFTDLSPSGNVVAIDERLGLQRLDTTTFARLNLPALARRGVKTVTKPREIEDLLTGRNKQIFLDHRSAAAAKHVALSSGDRQCYVLFRIDRRKRLRIFASLLYVSDPELFIEHGAVLGRYFAWRYRALVTLVEARVLGGTKPAGHAWVKVPGRPKMFKSPHLDASQIDYLYSELTSVSW